MKKLIAIILSTVLAGSLFAGCKGTATPSSNASISKSASVSISEEPAEISLWIMPLYDTFGDMVKAKFPAAVKEKYPNVTVKVELLSYDAGPEKLTVAMATNATPDFMQDGLSRLAPGIQGNLCADVTDLIGRLAGILIKGFEKEGVKDGKNYYVATNTNNGYNFAVNTDLAKELNVFDLLPKDKIHWSYDQFLDFCRKATAAGKSKSVYATQLFAGSRSADAVYYSFLMAGGTEILNADHTKTAANTATAEASLAVLKTLITEKVVPDGSATTKAEALSPLFEAQKLVMLFASSGAETMVKIFNKAKKGDIKGFACDFYQMPTPTGKTEPKVASFGTSGFVIFKNTNNAAKITAAKNAIEIWAKNTEIGNEVTLKGGAAPTFNNVSVDYGDATLNAQVKFAIEANGKYAVSNFGILEPWWTNFRETFYIELQGYFSGTKTVKQMLADWETNGNAAIAKAIAAAKK